MSQMASRGTADNDGRKRLLQRCLNHLKDLFLQKKDFRPRTFAEILKETYNEDIYHAIKEWVHKTGLPRVDRIEMTKDGKFLYKPPLPCRDTKSLWELLLEYETKHKGMLRKDVLDSIPGIGVADVALKHLSRKIDVLGPADEKLQVLVVRDKRHDLFPKDRQDAVDLFNSIDISQVDARHIQAELKRAGLNSVRNLIRRPPQLPSVLRKRIGRKKDEANSVNLQSQTVRHIKHNNHVIDDLKDYSEPPKSFKRRTRKPKKVLPTNNSGISSIPQPSKPADSNEAK